MMIEAQERTVYDVIIDGLAISINGMPTGGTERERQAWRNGARETAAVIAQLLTGRDIQQDPEV